MGDINALGIVDRSIQIMKQKIGGYVAAGKYRYWPDSLDKAVESMNSTPRGVLHGDEPENVGDNPKTQFLLEQDQARNVEHNIALNQSRVSRLLERLPPSAARRFTHAQAGQPAHVRRCGTGPKDRRLNDHKHKWENHRYQTRAEL